MLSSKLVSRESLLFKNIYEIPMYIKKIIFQKESSRILEFLSLFALPRSPIFQMAKSHSWKDFAHFFQNTSHLGSGQPWKVSSKCNIWERDEARLGLPFLDRGPQRCLLTSSPDSPGQLQAWTSQAPTARPDASSGQSDWLPATRLQGLLPVSLPDSSRPQSPGANPLRKWRDPWLPSFQLGQPRGGRSEREAATLEPLLAPTPHTSVRFLSPPPANLHPGSPRTLRGEKFDCSSHQSGERSRIWANRSRGRREDAGVLPPPRGWARNVSGPPLRFSLSAESSAAWGEAAAGSLLSSSGGCGNRSPNHTHVAAPIHFCPLGVPPETAFPEESGRPRPEHPP